MSLENFIKKKDCCSFLFWLWQIFVLELKNCGVFSRYFHTYSVAWIFSVKRGVRDYAPTHCGDPSYNHSNNPEGSTWILLVSGSSILF